VNEPETPILRMLDAYKAAVHAKDVDAFMALFDDDVRIFDMWGRWSYDGAAAWRAMAADWFGSLGGERVAVDFDEVQTLVAGDLAVASAFVTFTGLSADGRKLRSLNNRLTWALRLQAGTWKVVHEHTSAPVAHETGKVTLQR
jgi:uncharacterized protein (TIGR02246 family)